jgi:hypothetical protein
MIAKDQQHMDSIGKTLCENDSIVELDLSHNHGLADVGICRLSYWLAQAPAFLKRLGLRGNSGIHTQGAQALLLALQQNYKLECLELPYPWVHGDQLQHHVDLNKGGGRKLFLSQYSNNNNRGGVPASLWPLVLKRAGHWSSLYSGRTNSTSKKTHDEARRRAANVVYHYLLQGGSNFSPTPATAPITQPTKKRQHL